MMNDMYENGSYYFLFVIRRTASAPQPQALVALASPIELFLQPQAGGSPKPKLQRRRWKNHHTHTDHHIDGKCFLSRLVFSNTAPRTCMHLESSMYRYYYTGGSSRAPFSTQHRQTPQSNTGPSPFVVATPLLMPGSTEQTD